MLLNILAIGKSSELQICKNQDEFASQSAHLEGLFAFHPQEQAKKLGALCESSFKVSLDMLDIRQDSDVVSHIT